MSRAVLIKPEGVHFETVCRKNIPDTGKKYRGPRVKRVCLAMVGKEQR